MDNQQRKIVVIEPGYASYSVEKDILSKFSQEIHVVPKDAGYDEKVAMVRDADAVMVREAIVDADLIDKMERCQVIVRYGIGVDNIDQQAAKNKKIHVANIPQYGAEEVSNHAVTLVLAVSRWLVKRDSDVRKGIWGVGDAEPIYTFNGKGLGIIGFGSIARSFLEKMRPFGFKDIWIYDPGLTEEEIWGYGAHKASVEEVCRNSDVISLHAPLLEETRHILSEKEFGLMTPRTIVVNTGRGPLIDEKALVKALKSGMIKGAGIDVFENEPPGKANPLFKLDNVIVSDHAAWYSDRSIEELQTKAAKEVYRVLSGEKPQSWLNPW
ncbi:MAG: C-terminal binding protein [Desulfocapsaceae bacterium]|nr:C-terminal binding protein [Desulfocapsaceae bacterium]